MRLALTLVALFVPSIASAGSSSVLAARLPAGARSHGPAHAVAATTTAGARGRVIASSGYTSSGSCGSRGVLTRSTPYISSCSRSNRCGYGGYDNCGYNDGYRGCGYNTYSYGNSWNRGGCYDGGWNRGGCAPVRSCGGADVVVIAPTVVLAGGGGCNGTWASVAPAAAAPLGWGGSVHAARPADIHVAWRAVGAR